MKIIDSIFKLFGGKKSFFKTKNLVPGCGPKETLSESEKYKLVVEHYKTGKGTWNYTKGIVYRTSDNKKLFEVERNYSSFWHLFVEDHPDGHDYMFCGYDYQGYTVLQLDTGKRVDTKKSDHGWCFIDARASPDKTKLAADGCFWACPYECVVFDISNPMELPLLELGRADLESETKIEWGTDKLTVTNMYDRRKSDGVGEYDIPTEEYKKILQECIDKGNEEGDKYWKELFETVPKEICVIDWSKKDVIVTTKHDSKQKFSYIEAINTKDMQYYANIDWDWDTEKPDGFYVKEKPIRSQNWAKANTIKFTKDQEKEWQDYLRNKL